MNKLVDVIGEKLVAALQRHAYQEIDDLDTKQADLPPELQWIGEDVMDSINIVWDGENWVEDDGDGEGWLIQAGSFADSEYVDDCHVGNRDFDPDVTVREKIDFIREHYQRCWENEIARLEHQKAIVNLQFFYRRADGSTYVLEQQCSRIDDGDWNEDYQYRQEDCEADQIPDDLEADDGNIGIPEGETLLGWRVLEILKTE